MEQWRPFLYRTLLDKGIIVDAGEEVVAKDSVRPMRRVRLRQLQVVTERVRHDSADHQPSTVLVQDWRSAAK